MMIGMINKLIILHLSCFGEKFKKVSGRNVNGSEMCTRIAVNLMPVLYKLYDEESGQAGLFGRKWPMFDRKPRPSNPTGI